MRKNSQEIEATLIIYAENPLAVIGQIAGLTFLGSYRLLPQEPQAIHDLYFDTPEGALQTQKLALRVREIQPMKIPAPDRSRIGRAGEHKLPIAETRAGRWLTLKGPSRPTDWGGMERLEIEAPWSEEALVRVTKALMDRGIGILSQHQGFDYAHPLEVMTGLGLKVIQNRETRRQVRNIVSVGEEGSPVLAEMAIDTVVYHFGPQGVYHYEVEVEAKAESGSAVVKTVIESLVAMYGPALRRWDHDKLTTGQAIEKMLSEGALEGLLDGNGNLKPMAYDKIDAYLKRMERRRP